MPSVVLPFNDTFPVPVEKVFAPETEVFLSKIIEPVPLGERVRSSFAPVVMSVATPLKVNVPVAAILPLLAIVNLGVPEYEAVNKSPLLSWFIETKAFEPNPPVTWRTLFGVVVPSPTFPVEERYRLDEFPGLNAISPVELPPIVSHLFASV